ncbi:hypothetical protein [Collinsella aerofaciens]|uniref:hypothetical protein n=1 Tax=Collinsella aerofaciens TaxID=74426 RepID=UPI003218E05B
MSDSSVRMYRAKLRTTSATPKLVVVEAECFSPDERTAFALLSSRVAAVLVPCPAQGELAIQCQAHGCSLNQAAVIATSQRGLPLLLEAGIALALRGTGYENEAAADVVFQPRSSGGLAAAIEYACRLAA